MIDLPGVEVVQEGYHQTLAQVDLHQCHGNILTALHRGHLLQHGQRAAVFRLTSGMSDVWTQWREKEDTGGVMIA